MMLLFCVLAVVVVPAAVVDLRFRRIPNLLSLAGVLLGVAVNVFVSGIDGLLAAAAGMLLAFGIGFPLWLAGWFGAGDVKLLSAVGAIVNVKLLLPVLAGVAITGGVMAVLHLLGRRLQKEPFFVYAMSLVFAAKGQRDDSVADIEPESAVAIKKGMPYAIPVAIGSLATIVYLS